MLELDIAPFRSLCNAPGLPDAARPLIGMTGHLLLPAWDAVNPATLSPTMGGDPMLKAFIICVVAGLGDTYGAVAAAIVIGLLEAATQYVLGVRFGFALLLVLVIAVLIWRPAGFFGKSRVVRL